MMLSLWIEGLLRSRPEPTPCDVLIVRVEEAVVVVEHPDPPVALEEEVRDPAVAAADHGQHARPSGLWVRP